MRSPCPAAQTVDLERLLSVGAAIAGRVVRCPGGAGVVLTTTYFPAMAGVPVARSIYYQDGFGYTALQSGLGVTAYVLGSVIAAPLAGRVVTRIGRPLLLAGLACFAAEAITIAVLAGHASGRGGTVAGTPAVRDGHR